MSKYDSLSARTELEQTITNDLNSAFQKRGLIAEHQGEPGRHAPANIPDIIVSHESLRIAVECTKAKGAAQDREFNSIRDHLQQLKNEGPSRDCFCIFASPKTSQRMLDSIREHNFIRKDEPDLKILPLCFDSLELILSKLSTAVSDLYPVGKFTAIFNKHSEFVDDQRIKKLLYRELFPTDDQLGEEIERQEIERDQRILESLVKRTWTDLKITLENTVLRQANGRLILLSISYL